MHSRHCLVLLAIVLWVSVMSAPALGAGPVTNFADHPVYAQYSFGAKEADIVNLGTQPLAVPEGLIGAALGRDRLLRHALKKQGWEIRSHSFLKGIDSNFFFRRGDLEFALTGIWPTLTLAAVHDIQVIGLAEQGYDSVISKGRLRQITDLKGKRIGAPPGSTAHHGLLVALEIAGIPETEVTIVPLDISEMNQALIQNKVDAFSAWEPFSSENLRKHSEFSVVHRFLTCDYFYVSAAWAQKHAELADLVMAAYVRSLYWMKKDRGNLMRAIAWAVKDATRLLGKSPEATPEEMAAIASQSLPKIAAAPTVPSQDLTENGFVRRAFGFLQRQGKISTDVPWSRIEHSFDSAPLKKILADPGKWEVFTADYDE